MSLIVHEPGLFTTVQDAGRLGYREWGVPTGGAFDCGSAGLANAIVGNDPDRAVLELTLLGGLYSAKSPLALGIAGAAMESRIESSDGGVRVLEIPTSATLQAGDRLILGWAREGARTYLAVRGGWRTPIWMGSRSSEDRLQSGDILPAEPGTIRTRRLVLPDEKSPSAEPFRVIDGPDAAICGSWIDRAYRVGLRSDRMGLRLEGEPIAVESPADRLSAPVAPGAVQVAGGQLIVLGVAGGTMGGYPHASHVISADLDRLGQLRPGDLVRFRRTTLDEARAEARALRITRRHFLLRIATAAQDD